MKTYLSVASELTLARLALSPETVLALRASGQVPDFLVACRREYLRLQREEGERRGFRVLHVEPWEVVAQLSGGLFTLADLVEDECALLIAQAAFDRLPVDELVSLFLPAPLPLIPREES